MTAKLTPEGKIPKIGATAVIPVATPALPPRVQASATKVAKVMPVTKPKVVVKAVKAAKKIIVKAIAKTLAKAPPKIIPKPAVKIVVKPVVKTVKTVKTANAIRPMKPVKGLPPLKTPSFVKVEKTVKADKEKKPKLVRDSFTIPKAEYDLLTSLKARAVRLKQPAKKSELLRAGIKLLVGLSDIAFCTALVAIPALKTGRPVSIPAVKKT